MQTLNTRPVRSIRWNEEFIQKKRFGFSKHLNPCDIKKCFHWRNMFVVHQWITLFFIYDISYFCAKFLTRRLKNDASVSSVKEAVSKTTKNSFEERKGGGWEAFVHLADVTSVDFILVNFDLLIHTPQSREPIGKTKAGIRCLCSVKKWKSLLLFLITPRQIFLLLFSYYGLVHVWGGKKEIKNVLSHPLM